MKAAVVSYDALSKGEGLVAIPVRLKGLYPPSKVCGIEISVVANGMCDRGTDHVVGNQLQVARIDINLIHIEDSTYLAQDSGPSRFYAIRAEDGKDIIGIDTVFINQRLFITAGKVPQARDV